MMALLPMILPALIPGVLDFLRGLGNRLTGGAGAQPANVDEAIRLMGASAEQMKAFSALDAVGDTYKWVNAVRGLMRPAASAAVMALYAYCIFQGDLALEERVSPWAQGVMSYWFGDRTYLYLKRSFARG